MYEPEVDDYVIWDRGEYGKDEGWVYFKGDEVDNEKRVKFGWKPALQHPRVQQIRSGKIQEAENRQTRVFFLILSAAAMKKA